MRYRSSGGVMREDYPHAFSLDDLTAFDAFVGGATAVVPLRDAPSSGDGAIALRHDVDHNLDHALLFAEWEHERGYRATYFVLHTAWYYAEPDLEEKLHRLVELGHEVGLHHDAMAEAWRRGFQGAVDGSVLPIGNSTAAAEIVREELARLRGFGLTIDGVSAHGSELWKSNGVTNAFLWADGYVPADFGLQYEAYHLHRKAHYISDNRGGWSSPLTMEPGRQTHVLTHPCHWALEELAAAA
jgi:hypothetical protein